MRITGGTVRGRKLSSLKGTDNRIRPTSDRARQAVFNILGERIRNRKVIDLFAGTGSLGIEALSRGADFVVFVDYAHEAGAIIQKNLQTCFSKPRAFFFLHQLPAKTLAQKIEAKLPPSTQFDLVFLDPPYRKELAVPTMTMLEETNLLAPGAIVVVEEHHSVSLPKSIGSLRLTDKRKYGETAIWFYTL